MAICKLTKSEAAELHKLINAYDNARSELVDWLSNLQSEWESASFNKMSRADIAARIIEHLEARDPRTREELEKSMRDALAARPDTSSGRESFLSKWERIIKGIEL